MTLTFPSRGFRRTRERASGLLFAFGVDDLSTSLPTGHTLTVARAGSQTVLDTMGRVVTLGHSQPPFGAQWNATASAYEPGLEITGARTNLVFPSEDFGTSWAAVGTPTRTAAALACGDLVLDLIGDDAAGTLEGYTRTVTFTGDAVKMFSVFIAQGSSASSVLRVRDTSVNANRLYAAVTWSSGTPAVSMTTGTYIGKVRCYGGVWRLVFQTTSVTAANVNVIGIYPASDAALSVTGTGTLYVGGVQAEDSGGPGGAYVKTVGGTAASASTDASAAIAFAPQDCSIYIRHATPYWASSAIDLGACTLLTIGTDSGSPTNAIRIRYDFSSVYRISASGWDSAGGSIGVTATAPTAESVSDMVVQLNSATTAARMRIDVGGGFGAYATAGVAMGSAWSAGGIQIGDVQAAGSAFFGSIRTVLIAPGARTLAQMRGLAI